MDDDAFTAHVADRLGALPCVKTVTLGGSRAEGTHRPDSDWDFSIYYQRDLPRRATGSAGDIGPYRAGGARSRP